VVARDATHVAWLPAATVSLQQTKPVSDWLGVIIAGLALALSITTWALQYRRSATAERRADVTVFFHWLTSMARVEIPGHESVSAGYHLVISNRGPATAREVSLTLRDAQARTLELLDLHPDELPLSVLDVSGRYPIPFVYEPFSRHARRFEATLTWTDARGPQSRIVPLRRGQVPG
jgi:hypothetical protein